MKKVRSKIIPSLTKFVMSLVLSLGAVVANAATYVIPSVGDLIGHTRVVHSHSGERLGDVGMRTGMGYYEMQAANPNINPYANLTDDTEIVIPSQFILPPGPRQGIVINLPEFRLYYYVPGENIVKTFPIGIGREGVWGTPVGITKVIKKKDGPSWYPTEHVRAYAASQGTPIPAYFPPGPDNPLGAYALYLGWPTILIHGTNVPSFIGTRISGGCIRMMPNAIKELFEIVPIGTSVRVINQPFKAGWLNQQLYLEAYLPLDEEQGVYNETLSSLVNIVTQETQSRPTVINWSGVQDIAAKTTGIPQVISLN